MVVDVDGEWHTGFRKFEFAPSQQENNFITEFALDHGGQIDFSSFVHPLRWQSFYGANYLLAKAMISALAGMAKHYRAAAKALAAATAPTEKTRSGSDEETSDVFGAPDEDESATYETIEVEGLEADVGYTAEGEYPELPLAECRAVVAASRKPLEVLRYATRATEYAFWQAGPKREALQPSWLQNVEWTDDMQKRTKWRRLRLEQRAVGERAVDLRYRSVVTSTKVRTYAGGKR